MEPKDLKNSDELKSPETKDLKISEKETISDDVKKTELAEEKTEAATQAKEEEKKVAVAEEKVAEAEVVEEKPQVEAKGEDEVKAEASETPSAEKEETTAPEEEKQLEVAAETVAEIPESEKKTEAPEKVETEVAETKKTTEKTAKKKVEEAEQDTAAKAENPAETSEEKAEPDKKEEKSVLQRKERTDYSKHTQVELVNALREIIQSGKTVNEIRHDVEAIKAAFYKIVKENEADALNKFTEEGGAEDDFKPEEDPYENDIKDLLKEYRHLRIAQSKVMEAEKEDNLKRKYEVIEKIKGLINNEESINKTFNEFRELQQEWREIGLVPQADLKNLWDTYHFHVENFYDYIKINRELRDLDLKKNHEAKIKLCEKAEELLLDPSVIKAFNTLQKYHEQWREIGPVPREHKDDIWERFKAATSKINKKHQEFFEDRKDEQKKNLDAKTALCEQVESILEKEMGSHKEWDQYSKELIKLQKVWRTIGFAPRKDNNKIYERFRMACDQFFDAKREFYSKNKEEQQNNLQLKIDLCVQAEALKDSTDWKKTTQDFINIQKKWKEIGPVSRKQSDAVWKRFRTACDYFFDKKSEHFSDVDSEQIDNLKAKEQIIEDIKAFKSSENIEENLKQLKQIQRRWSEIGHVPFKKKDELQSTFRELINKLYDDLNIDDEKRNMLKFRTKMNTFSESSRGQNKMRLERDKYMNKMKQLENDLVTLENNIGFFANSKNAESLIADVEKKIEVTKQKIEFLKDKIRVIDEIDDKD